MFKNANTSVTNITARDGEWASLTEFSSLKRKHLYRKESLEFLTYWDRIQKLLLLVKAATKVTVRSLIRYWKSVTQGAETPPYFVQLSMEVTAWPDDGIQPERIESGINKLLKVVHDVRCKEKNPTSLCLESRVRVQSIERSPENPTIALAVFEVVYASPLMECVPVEWYKSLTPAADVANEILIAQLVGILEEIGFPYFIQSVIGEGGGKLICMLIITIENHPQSRMKREKDRENHVMLRMYSSGNPTNIANPIKDARVQLDLKTIGGSLTLFETTLCKKLSWDELDGHVDLNPQGYLSAYTVKDIQLICCQADASTLWLVPPTVQARLGQSLTWSMNFIFSWQFTRDWPKGKEVVKYELHAQDQDLPTPVEVNLVSGDIVLNRGNGEWWSFHDVDASDVSGCGGLAGPMAIIVYEETPQGILGETLNKFSIWGLYITFVLAVGRFIRLQCSDLRMRIPFENLPSCDRLLAICEDIYAARAEGELEVEEQAGRYVGVVKETDLKSVGLRPHAGYGLAAGAETTCSQSFLALSTYRNKQTLSNSATSLAEQCFSGPRMASQQPSVRERLIPGNLLPAFSMQDGTASWMAATHASSTGGG
ncbi:hypothetical protein RJ639_007928 [Escallonia herrerae]|uniref:Piezo non-specific cation channel cap domain-containing protein n=1 Tax=Escallonia herrerae TaxID=1293975 RepID=A0AA88VRQ9_9ASTE|nr:hypothetical protein RJ639_007928 [Escallonia herrerae]